MFYIESSDQSSALCKKKYANEWDISNIVTSK